MKKIIFFTLVMFALSSQAMQITAPRQRLVPKQFIMKAAVASLLLAQQGIAQETMNHPSCSPCTQSHCESNSANTCCCCVAACTCVGCYILEACAKSSPPHAHHKNIEHEYEIV